MKNDNENNYDNRWKGEEEQYNPSETLLKYLENSKLPAKEEINIEYLRDLDSLTPQLFNTYIDLANNVFVVDILTTKKIHTMLSLDNNFIDFLNKEFHELHENLLYGFGSVECTGWSEMNILDKDNMFKTIDTSRFNNGIFGSSVFNEFDIELAAIANHECSKLYKDVENEEYRIKIAYSFENINLELLRHTLDNTLHLLD